MDHGQAVYSEEGRQEILQCIVYGLGPLQARHTARRRTGHIGHTTV